MKDGAESDDKSCWFLQQCNRQLMYVTCHVLGASGKIKHLFVWDSKESVDILVCIFAKSLASKALLQLIACSIKECTTKY